MDWKDLPSANVEVQGMEGRNRGYNSRISWPLTYLHIGCSYILCVVLLSTLVKHYLVTELRMKWILAAKLKMQRIIDILEER